MSLLSDDDISSVTESTPTMTEKSRHHDLEKPAALTAEQQDTIPPAYYSTSQSSSSFATISLHMADKIRFLQFPDSDLPKLVDIITSGWSNGVQSTRQYAGSYEVQLKGYPWMHSSGTIVPGDNHARRLIRLLLEGLYEMGWVFDTAVRTCKKQSEKDTLLFVKHLDTYLPPLHDWFVISYDGTDTMNVQRAPQPFTQLLTQRLGNMVTTKTEDDANVVLKMKGVPWMASGEDTIKVRKMLLIVRESLDVWGGGGGGKGKIYASFRMMNGSYEGDILVCVRESPSGTAQQGSIL